MKANEVYRRLKNFETPRSFWNCTLDVLLREYNNEREASV
jgi:hypothetical protein